MEKHFTKDNSEQKEIRYVAGRNAVLELLRSGRGVDKIYIKANAIEGALKLIASEARGKGIPVMEASRSKLDELADGVPHQGVVAFASAHEYVEISDILAYAEEKGEMPLIVIADGVEDPHNLGAVIRTAECAGAHGLIIPKRRSSGLTSVVAKASAGAIEHLRIARVTNLAAAVDELKEKGVWIYAAEAGGTPYYECDMKSPAALIFGSEGNGVSRLLRDKSDFVVSIPLYGAITSLNVSAAAAIILYEAAKQHRMLKGRAIYG